MDMLARAEAICQQIDDAFVSVPMPPREQVADERHPDGAYAVRHFGGRRREDIQIRCAMTEDLHYMSAEAVAYYLPAFLKHLLREAEDFDVFIGVVGYLHLVSREPAGDPSGNLPLAQYLPEQRAAMLAWVSFVRQHLKSYRPGELRAEYADRLEQIWGWMTGLVG